MYRRGMGDRVFRKTLLFAPLCPFRSAGFTRGGESRPGQGFGNEVFSGQKWKSAGGGHCPWRLAEREREREGEVEKGRRDVLLKFATLSVASLRLIKNCAGLCASLFMPVAKEIAHA